MPARRGHAVTPKHVIPTSSLPTDFSVDQLVAAVIDSSEDAIIMHPLNGLIVSWNFAAERLYGWTAAEAIGRSVEMISPASRKDEIAAIRTRVFMGERVNHLETVRRHKEGHEIPVSVTVLPIHDSEGSVIGVLSMTHDVSERKRHERELAESQALLEQTQRVGHIGGWTSGTAPDAPLTCTSETFRIFGTVERTGLTMADFFQRVHPDDRSRVRMAALSAFAHEGHFELEHRIVRPDGSQRWVLEAIEVSAGADGVPAQVTGVVQDITEHREAEEKARGIESHLRLLAENSRDLIFRYRIFPVPGFEFVSPAALAITGYAPDEFYADPELIYLLVDPTERDSWLERMASSRVRTTEDVEIVRKDRSKLWVNQSLFTVRDVKGAATGVDGITRDISDRKAAELELAHQVLHDPLTGLANRVLAMDRIEHGLARASRERELLAVLFIDLDRFKAFNDTRGHDFGDAVLKSVADRLLDSSRTEDTVGRLSGDEFVVVCEKVLATPDAVKIAHHALAAFTMPFEIEGEQVRVSASIGVATGEPGDSVKKLLHEADLAMYHAKQAGGARYEVFSDALEARGPQDTGAGPNGQVALTDRS
jgi:diguanylate cyclase (GGDEF)-like protein/PAS domain S-box-containing protein